LAFYGEARHIEPGWSSVLFYSLVLLEIMLLVYNVIFSSLVLNIIRKSSLFHHNLIHIAMFLFVHGYIHVTVRLTLILYQQNLISLEDANMYSVSHMVVYIASMLRNYQSVAVMQLFPATIAAALLVINSRRVKTILLSDRYELSTKYQLQENMKAFTFIKIIIVWGFLGTTASNLILIFADIFKTDGNIVLICGAAYEMFSMM
ncbi:hypothetical protein PENTCL1PPCAC_19115, partial [Pristionchus entomophagus]